MAFRSRDQAQQELAPLLPAFRDAVLKAHDRLLRNPDLPDLDKGTRTRMIRDFAVKELCQQLDGTRGVHIEVGNQTVLFCVGQNWVVQVHKLSEAGEVAKNFTQLSMNLRSNTIDQDALPNIPASATVLFLGHVETGDIDEPDVRLVCSGHNTWSLDLGDIGIAPVVEITPLVPVVEEPGTQVVVKPGKKRSRAE